MIIEKRYAAFCCLADEQGVIVAPVSLQETVVATPGAAHSTPSRKVLSIVSPQGAGTNMVKFQVGSWMPGHDRPDIAASPDRKRTNYTGTRNFPKSSAR